MRIFRSEMTRWEPPTANSTTPKKVTDFHKSYDITLSDADQKWKNYMRKLKKEFQTVKTEVKSEVKTERE